MGRGINSPARSALSPRPGAGIEAGAGSTQETHLRIVIEAENRYAAEEILSRATADFPGEIWSSAPKSSYTQHTFTARAVTEFPDDKVESIEQQILEEFDDFPGEVYLT